MRKKPFNFINKLSDDKIELAAEFLKDESAHLLGLVLYFLDANVTKVFLSKIDDSETIGRIMQVTRVINIVNYEIINTIENNIKRFLSKVPKGYKFNKSDNPMKIKELIVSLSNEKIKPALKAIDEIDSDLFKTITRELSITNPEKLI